MLIRACASLALLIVLVCVAATWHIGNKVEEKYNAPETWFMFSSRQGKALGLVDYNINVLPRGLERNFLYSTIKLNVEVSNEFGELYSNYPLNVVISHGPVPFDRAIKFDFSLKLASGYVTFDDKSAAASLSDIEKQIINAIGVFQVS